jgi:hypothetical protein
MAYPPPNQWGAPFVIIPAISVTVLSPLQKSKSYVSETPVTPRLLQMLRVQPQKSPMFTERLRMLRSNPPKGVCLCP